MAGMLKVPEDIFQTWELAGNKLSAISEYFQLSEDLVLAMYAATGDRWEQPGG